MHKPKLSKDEVARSALRILDDFGLPDLTMRRLASDLGVQPSALYWHFPNKQTLLADLADRIVSKRHSEDHKDGWDNRLRVEARALRDALLAYRDSAEIVSSSIALGLGENLALSNLRGAFNLSPFPEETAERAAATMLHFIIGQVSLEQQSLQYDSLGARAHGPLLLEIGSSDNDFHFGVETIITGLQERASTELSH